MNLKSVVLIGAVCLAVASVPVLTHDDDDDDEGRDCDQAAAAPVELLAMYLSCSPESGVRIDDMSGTGDVAGIGEIGGTGPVANCLDFVNSLLSQTEGCVGPHLVDFYGNGGLSGRVLCTGDRNQVVSDLAIFLLGIQTPGQPVSVIGQPVLPAAPRLR